MQSRPQLRIINKNNWTLDAVFKGNKEEVGRSLDSPITGRKDQDRAREGQEIRNELGMVSYSTCDGIVGHHRSLTLDSNHTHHKIICG